jgi:hypothetical protein
VPGAADRASLRPAPLGDLQHQPRGGGDAAAGGDQRVGPPDPRPLRLAPREDGGEGVDDGALGERREGAGELVGHRRLDGEDLGDAEVVVFEAERDAVSILAPDTLPK